jgi:phage terminase small subunit
VPVNPLILQSTERDSLNSYSCGGLVGDRPRHKRDIERGIYMLTPNQEKFVQGIIEGKSQAEAYREAYPKQRSSDKTVWEAASRLMANSKVNARIKELRDQLAKPSIMSAQERMEWLTNLINNAEEGTNEKLKAIDIMNKMQGEYVQKVEADVKSEVTINVELVEDE